MPSQLSQYSELARLAGPDTVAALPPLTYTAHAVWENSSATWKKTPVSQFAVEMVVVVRAPVVLSVMKNSMCPLDCWMYNSARASFGLSTTISARDAPA